VRQDPRACPGSGAVLRSPSYAGVDGHEVGAQLRLLRSNPEEVVLLHMDYSAVFVDRLDKRLVERYTADGKCGVPDYLAADLGKISTG